MVSYLPGGQPRLKSKHTAKALFKPLLVAQIFYYLINQNMAKPGVNTDTKGTKGVITGRSKHIGTITASVSHKYIMEEL